MKISIISAALILSTSSIAAATQYSGTFETDFIVSSFETKAVTVTMDVATDGINFQIDSINVTFTDTLQGLGSYTDSTLDPIAVSATLFSSNEPLAFIPGSSIAVFTDFPLGYEAAYAGVYKETGGFFSIFDHTRNGSVGVHTPDLLVDFTDSPNKLTMTFSTTPSVWLMSSVSPPDTGTHFGAALEIPTESVIVMAIPEPSTAMLSLALVFGVILHRFTK